MCWKCSSGILADDKENKGAKVLAGCKDCDSIKSYEDAKELCPLIVRASREGK